MARKTCTRELKLQALRLLTEQGLSVAEVARQLGAGENCLRVWRAAKGHGAAAFPGPRNLSAEQEEFRGLRAERDLSSPIIAAAARSRGPATP